MSKGKWRPKEVRDAEKRGREIRRERKEAKRIEKEERRKRREAKAALKALIKADIQEPRKGPDAFLPVLKCRDCGGGMIVAMPRDPETGDNIPICERCV